MKSTREQFEEIWPVPEGVYWNDEHAVYVPSSDSDDYLLVYEWNDRLDTFTRCQEMMAPVMSLVDEMVAELSSEVDTRFSMYDWLCRAKQKLEQIK